MHKTRRKYKLGIEEIDFNFIQRKNRTTKTLNVGENKEYWYFRRNTPVKKDKQLERGEYRKIAQSFFKATAELIKEYEGGVFLSRYGYFSLLVKPFGKSGYIKGQFFYDSLEHTEGYNYVPILDTDVTTRSCIRRMIMDRTYNSRLKKEFWNLISQEGFRPKNYYSMLKSIYGHSNSKIN